MSAIDDIMSDEIYKIAEDLSMSILVEVHTADEAKKALRFKNAMIGINNRNLKNLKTDIKNTFDIYEILAGHTPLVCESGIKSEDEVNEIYTKTGINNFLIGESLLKDLSKGQSLLAKITKISI